LRSVFYCFNFVTVSTHEDGFSQVMSRSIDAPNWPANAIAAPDRSTQPTQPFHPLSLQRPFSSPSIPLAERDASTHIPSGRQTRGATAKIASSRTSLNPTVISLHPPSQPLRESGDTAQQQSPRPTGAGAVAARTLKKSRRTVRASPARTDRTSVGLSASMPSASSELPELDASARRGAAGDIVVGEAIQQKTDDDSKRRRPAGSRVVFPPSVPNPPAT
jgi:hypothetical protein